MRTNTLGMRQLRHGLGMVSLAMLAACGAQVNDGDTAEITGHLQDTGIGSGMCYQAGSNTLVSCTSAEALALSKTQDGMIGLDVTAPDATDGHLGFSYTKVDATGTKMAKAATGWKCVLDNHTGLLWEGKTDDGGLHDKDNRYTHLGNNAEDDVSGYVAKVNTEGLCGRKDWRLPTVWELQGLVQYAVPLGSGPTVDAAWFTSTEVNVQVYWAADQAAVSDTTNTWGIEFVLGDVRKFARGYPSHVRLVAGTQVQENATGRFVTALNGTEVTDTQTGLVWRRCQEGATWNGNDACAAGPVAGYTYTHENALLRAVQVATQDGKAWRVPNVRELSSLIDRTRTSGLLINPTAFPQMSGGWFWTSTPVIYPGATEAGSVRTLYFGSGYVYGADGRAGLGQLLLVRDAK